MKVDNFLKQFSCILLVVFGAKFSSAQSIKSKILSDVRAFEVSACKPSKNSIVSVWMEKRPTRKDNSEEAADMRVAYRSSFNNGKNWTNKEFIDLEHTFGTGNPYVTSNEKGDTFMTCMHIGQDFFSGNISLYQFDFKKHLFNLKSIPVKSNDNLLDKPSLVCDGNNIHLVYVAYSKNFKNSVKYQLSKDNGISWSEAIDVFPDHSITYLGPAMVLSDNKQVFISTGSYAGKGIYMTKNVANSQKIEFEPARKIGSIAKNLGSAMTEMTCKNGNLLLTWQNPHQRNETWICKSQNLGVSWSSPFMVTSFGNLLSAEFDDKYNIHCIYSDFKDEKFSVVYKSFDNENRIVKEEFIKSPVELKSFKEYLGAFQKLLIQNNKMFAFWIDYPGNNTLNFSEWKI